MKEKQRRNPEGDVVATVVVMCALVSPSCWFLAVVSFPRQTQHHCWLSPNIPTPPWLFSFKWFFFTDGVSIWRSCFGCLYRIFLPWLCREDNNVCIYKLDLTVIIQIQLKLIIVIRFVLCATYTSCITSWTSNA